MSGVAAETERIKATERAKSVYEQADARLNQATRDAGRIIAEAEQRAKEIAGEAHDALRDKQLLERAAAAMRNIVEGYGDRYIMWAVVVQELARKQMEEQREIKARMRDEEKDCREYEQQMRLAAKDEELKKKALEEKERELAEIRRALEHAAAQDKAQLEEKLAAMQQANEGLRQDLVAATERKLTIAQQTKTGTVYIISNVGAFGEGIYKIGQTRRPDPQERIDELGDASVPFDFDVHAWIRSDNAPVLEHRLQKRFLAMQLNKVNPRKEFFRVTLKDIRDEVEELNQEEPLTVTHWTDAAAATQYRESLDIENNPEKMAKWLKRQESLADRELRLEGLRLTVSDVSEPQTEATMP